MEMTNNFETLREEVTSSHTQVVKQSENTRERVNRYKKRVAELEQASGHVSKQYDELKTQFKLSRNQEQEESKNNSEEVQCTWV
jgi:hypothetical protein